MNARCAVFRSQRIDQADEVRLVLAAVDIASQRIHDNSEWLVTVAEADEAKALAELSAYQDERAQQVAVEPAKTILFRGAVAGTVVFVICLVLLEIAARQSAFGIDWFSTGRMRAGDVMKGEWWRCVTALTLHVDLGHLLSNLLYGSLFGYLTGRLFGGGVAWLLIVIGGAVGNGMNAVVQAADHTSIGASTAVFAALGMMVAHALRPPKQSVAATESMMKRWSPLIGGVVLLGLTGMGGENTDVIAHTTGFFAGLVTGWFGCQIPTRWLARPAVQWTAGSIGVLLCVGAWFAASHA